MGTFQQKLDKRPLNQRSRSFLVIIFPKNCVLYITFEHLERKNGTNKQESIKYSYRIYSH